MAASSTPSSRFIFLRVRGAAADEVQERLSQLAPVVEKGQGTAADATEVWFSLHFSTAQTIQAVRERLMRLGIGDHVVRVDLMPKRNDGGVYAHQLDLFSALPSKPAVEAPRTVAPVRKREREDDRVLVHQLDLSEVGL